MIRIGRLFMVFLLFILIAAALNISNDGINQLTAQDHKAVIGADYEKPIVSLYLVGQSYDYDLDKLQKAISNIEFKTYQLTDKVVQHFVKCYKIFKAVFLY